MVDRFEQFSAAMSGINQCILKLQREEMEKYGLKGVYAQYLAILSHYPEGLTSAQMCECCDKDKAAISRTVTELENAGMLTRQCNGSNRYRAQLLLTEMGYEAAARVAERAKYAVEQAGSGLTDEQRGIFYYALGLIADNLQNICEEGLNDKIDF